MKKIFNILVIAGVVLSLTGISQAKPAVQLIRPIPATDVKIVKKSPLPIGVERKGKPEVPPGQGKEKKSGEQGRVATGVVGEEVAGEKYAVVIGICDYPGTKNDICLSDGDALNMYEALTNLYGYDPVNVHLLRDNNATYDAILAAVDDVRDKEVLGDEIVFFFSGHGADGIAQDEDSERKDESIVTHDGTNIEFIWDGQLRSWFSDFDTSRIIFIFDSCLAGGMKDVAAEGRLVVMGTGENQVGYVYSNGEEGEGVFSHYFVNEGILQGFADGYNQLETPDGKVVTEEAFDYSNENIPKFLQKPVISDNFTDDLFL